MWPLHILHSDIYSSNILVGIDIYKSGNISKHVTASCKEKNWCLILTFSLASLNIHRLRTN